MRLTCLLAVTLLCVLYISQVSGTCICGALSEDYCTCRGLRQNPKILFGSQTLLTSQSNGGCQCGNHIIEPIITEPHTCVKSIPIGVVYTTPLCSSCSAFGRPVCSECLTNCKPLCSKCALHGKPVCSACVASIGLPTVNVFSLNESETEEQAEPSNPSPQKVMPSSDMSEQASNPSATYSFVSNGKDFVEVTETKSNLTTAQLMGLRKFFGYNNNKANNGQLKASTSSSASSSSSFSGLSRKNNNNDYRRNEIEKKADELIENTSSDDSDETKPQALYITYTGLGFMPDKLTKIITIPPSMNDQRSKSTSSSSSLQQQKQQQQQYEQQQYQQQQQEEQSSSYERDYSFKQGGSFLDLFRF